MRLAEFWRKNLPEESMCKRPEALIDIGARGGSSRELGEDWEEKMSLKRKWKVVRSHKTL